MISKISHMLAEITKITLSRLNKKEIVTPSDYLEEFIETASSITTEDINFKDFANEMFECQINKLEKLRSEVISDYSLIAETAEAAATAIKNKDEISLSRIASEMNLMKERLIEMEKLANTDQLTSLKNRRWFFDNITDNSHIFKSDGTAAILDLNDFKDINDHFGHSVGDRVLSLFSKELLNFPGIAIRYGGDEFIIIARKEDELELETSIQRLKVLLFSKKFLHQEKSFKISFSAGHSVFFAGETFEDVVNRIDKIMYADKENSKNAKKH